MRVIKFSPRARREITAAADWWEKNREKAPDAFDDDLSSALQQIARTPFCGRPVPARIPGVRKLFLDRIRYHLYFRVLPDEIEVLSIWHASRRPPHL